ncbi:MAG: carbohydrate porin [Planctomyces sp.]|nr:carbohydrate porin [Planctomyces sp.]
MRARRIMLRLNCWLGACLLALSSTVVAGADNLDLLFCDTGETFCAPGELTAQFISAPVSSDSLAERPLLLGDAGGLRPALAEYGISANLSTTQYYQGVTSGGREQTFQYGGRNDYYITMDGGKLGVQEGLIVDLHGESRYGESTYGLVGGLSPANAGLLFPVPNEDVTALTQVKVTQFLSEQFIVFGGKINVVDGYTNTFAAGKGQTQFMNTAFVLPPILGRTVPYSSLGAGFAILDGMEPIFSMMIMDPVNHPTTSGFDDLFANGVSIFGEVNVPVNIANRAGHQQLYFSWSNRDVTALEPSAYIDTPIGPLPILPKISNSWSLLYAFDQYLVVDPCDPKRGWGLFGQFGLSDGNPNPIRWSATLGVGGSSPLRSRPLDTFGVGYYYFQLSSELKNTVDPFIPLANNQGIEAYYNVGVTKWLNITPNLQVIDPATRANNTAILVGLRTHLVF